MHAARFTLSANTRHSSVVSLLVLGVFRHILLCRRLLSSDLVIYFSRYLFDLVRYVVLNSVQLYLVAPLLQVGSNRSIRHTGCAWPITILNEFENLTRSSEDMGCALEGEIVHRAHL